MPTILQYTLRDTSRISAGRTAEVQNSRTIHDILPGTVIRGALAAAWWREQDATDRNVAQLRFDELFARSLEVRDAVPHLDGQPAELIPLSFVRCKYPQPGCPNGWHDQVRALIVDCPNCGRPLISGKGWAVDPAWTTRQTRTALQAGVAVDDQLFTRRAMAAHLTYAGSVRLRDPDPQALDWLSQQRVLAVGGQRSTLGRCVWAVQEAEEVMRPAVSRLRLVLRSRTILIGEYGQATTDLAGALTETLARVGDSTGGVERIWTRPDLVTGWHGLAGIPKPEERALAAGSTAVLTNWGDAALDQLEQGLGIRRLEGYGQVEILSGDSGPRYDDLNPLEDGTTPASSREPAPPQPSDGPQPGVPDWKAQIDDLLTIAPDRGRTTNGLLAQARAVQRLRERYPESMVQARIDDTVNLPWARELSGKAQSMALAILRLPDRQEVINDLDGRKGS